MDNDTRLLLVSSSIHNGQYLGHCVDAVKSFFAACNKVLFVPYALRHDMDNYYNLVADRLNGLGIEVETLHTAKDPVGAIGEAEGIFVGGGNTFVLLEELRKVEGLEVIRDRVMNGCPYMGSSAGANLAGVDIGTTNDMPVVPAPDTGALGLVPFNINPHYLERDPDAPKQGESRDERINEFLHYNPERTVVAVFEDAFLLIEGDTMHVRGAGPSGAKVFRSGVDPAALSPGSSSEI